MSAPKINGKNGRKRKNASQSAGPSNYKRSARCQIDEEEAENQRNDEQNQPGEITFPELIRMIRENPHAKCRCAKLPMGLRIVASFYKHLIEALASKPNTQQPLAHYHMLASFDKMLEKLPHRSKNRAHMEITIYLCNLVNRHCVLEKEEEAVNVPG